MIKKISLTLFFSFLSLEANLFQITDLNGNVISEKKLKHKENSALTQKESEFSLQAMYEELYKAEIMARRAKYAQEKYLALEKRKKEAKNHGKEYKLTKLDNESLIEYAKYFKGGRYVWGGTTPDGFDCSGYVQYLFKKQNINLPRTAFSQSKKGMDVDKNNLEKGDLLFFLTDKKRRIPITHVGIYIGENKFIHAASKKRGIIISPIDKGYYANKFVKAKRILN